MKKLICAALVAGSVCAMADEAKCENGVCALPGVAAEGTVQKPARPQMTPEQRAEIKAKREKFMAERKAAMEAKKLEIVKKYIADEEQAKALIKELQELQETMRPGMRRPPMPKAAKPAKAK